MARDYKHRVQQNASYANNRRRQQQRKPPVMWWRWLLVAALVGAFVVFLNMIRNMVPELLSGKAESEQPQKLADEKLKQDVTIKAKPVTTPAPANDAVKAAAGPTPTAVPIEPEGPRYDFYTILPQAETVVPDYEIKSRVREELVGKTKAVKYVMQAGSFHELPEAERHKAKLALLGIESKIEKAKINNAIWYRIKVGPYDNPSSVSKIKELLQKNGIGVIVTEVAPQ